MDLIIVDCQNDFISGSLACQKGEEAAEKIAEFIKENKENLNVFYTADFHPENHISFEAQGGIWPPHCVEGTEGAEIHKVLKESDLAPNADNIYYKGRNPEEEEYSGYQGKNESGKALKDAVSDEVHIVGIASEYCVKNTAEDFLKDGKSVTVYKDMLGYVDEEDHIKNLKELEQEGIKVK